LQPRAEKAVHAGFTGQALAVDGGLTAV